MEMKYRKGAMCETHTVRRFPGSGMTTQHMADMQDVKKVSKKTPHGKTGEPTKTATMSRDFTRTNGGRKKKK